MTAPAVVTRSAERPTVGGPTAGGATAGPSPVGSALDGRPRLAVASVAAIAVVSPYDLALPPDGLTELHLRPLLLLTAALAAVAVVASGSRVDRAAALAVGAVVAGLVVATLASPDPSVGWAIAVRALVLGLAFVAAATVIDRPAARHALVTGLAVGAGTAAVIGLAVLAAGGDRLGSGHLVGQVSETRGVVRLTRPFSHANVAAASLAPAAVVLAVEAVASRRPGSHRPTGRAATLLAVALLTAVALGLTLSRSGVGSVLLVAAGSVVAASTAARRADRMAPAGVADGRRRAPRWSAVCGCLAVAVTAVGAGLASGRWGDRLDPVNTPGPATLSRPEIWGQAIRAVVERPVTGVGPGRFGLHSAAITAPDRTPVVHAHQPVLDLLATGGTVAVAGLVVAAVVLGRRLGPAPHRRAPLGLTAGLGVALLGMAVDHPLLFSSSGNLIALLAGAWFAAARSDEP